MMQRIWNEVKNHPLALALFMVWWLALALLNFVVSRREQESVAQLYYVAPTIAGALVCWWRRSRADRITVGTMAGATVLVLQFALMLPRELTEAVHRGKGLLGVLRVLVDVETLAFGALACVVGAVLGFLGRFRRRDARVSGRAVAAGSIRFAIRIGFSEERRGRTGG